MTPWQLYHTYEKLVEQNTLPPILHPGCETDKPMVARVYSDAPDDFILWCPECRSNTRPGVSTLRNIEAAVQEFFDVRMDL